MKFSVVVAITLLSIFIFACQMPKVLANEEVEKLYGVTHTSEQKLRIKVISNGCTNEDDFITRLSEEGLVVLRTKQDKCRRRPFLKEVDISYPKTSEDIPLLNPIFVRKQ